MPKCTINGIHIYYEETGRGYPLVLSHEFAGDYRSWEPQVRFFGRRYRVITYSARGYIPSEIPTDLDDYTQENAVDDLRGLLNHLKIDKAHIGGLSMGGNVALNFGLAYPQMASSLIIAGTGSGSTDPRTFRERVNELSKELRDRGMTAMNDYSKSSNRVQLLRKDPKGYQEFLQQFFEHSNIGSALTFQGIQGRRPSIFALEKKLQTLDIPTLILTGDEDDACIEPSVFMKRNIPNSGLVVLPQSGHAINLEEPDLFNASVLNFLTAVEANAWTKRDYGRKSGALV